MKRIVTVLLLSALVLFAGTSVAYYNTASLGYDDANLFTVYEGGFRLLEFDFNYQKMRAFAEKMAEKAPDNIITISCFDTD